MARKSRKTGSQDRPHQAGFVKSAGEDLFRRRRVKDLSDPGTDSRRRGFKGVNPLHAGFAAFMLLFGMLSVALVMLNLISNLWFASLVSMSGSLAVMAGVWLLYDAVRERRSVDNLVRDAIMRALREKN
jgi:protein-S-isoprenylcysteine O-methyltransferase Ste14